MYIWLVWVWWYMIMFKVIRYMFKVYDGKCIEMCSYGLKIMYFYWCFGCNMGILYWNYIDWINWIKYSMRWGGEGSLVEKSFF